MAVVEAGHGDRLNSPSRSMRHFCLLLLQTFVLRKALSASPARNRNGFNTSVDPGLPDCA